MLYTKNANVTTTSPTTILTVPNGYVAHWNMLFITNIGGSTNGVGIYVDKSDGSRIDILGGGNISSKEYILLSDAVFVLQPEDEVVAFTESAGDVEFVMTFDLLEAPAVFVNFNGS
jgi:hypothetical protein